MASEENKIQKEILQTVQKMGLAFIWRNNQIPVKGRRFVGLKGVPDLIGILPCGTFIGIEVKTPKGKLTRCQEQFRDDCMKNNGLYIVARSVNDVLEKLVMRKEIFSLP